MFEELLAGAFQDLIDYRRSLPSTMTAEEIREAVLARAKETGFTIHALVPEKYREEGCGGSASNVMCVMPLPKDVSWTNVLRLSNAPAPSSLYRTRPPARSAC